MAGNCKPDGVGSEVQYTTNSYKSYAGSNAACPLFDGRSSGFGGRGEFYWFGSRTYYLDITIKSKCNIYGLSQPDYYDAYHRASLVIKRYGDSGWVDISGLYPTPPTTAKPLTWYKIISNLPAGRYHFTSDGYRMESEWYLEVCKLQLYKKNDLIYGMQNGAFTKLADDWSALTDAEKVDLFKSTNYEIASAADLATLGKFKVLMYAEDDEQQTLSLTAVPHDQLALPKGLISLESFDGIDKATLTSTISGSGVCKLLVTTDGTTYQAYDFTAQTWQAVDHTDLSAVKASGIDAAALSAIDRTAWDALTTGKTGIGFAYFLSIEDTADTCAVDQLDLQVDMRGSWDKAVHGTDYKYGYPLNHVLRVQLLADGDYKINYQG